MRCYVESSTMSESSYIMSRNKLLNNVNHVVSPVVLCGCSGCRSQRENRQYNYTNHYYVLTRLMIVLYNTAYDLAVNIARATLQVYSLLK